MNTSALCWPEALIYLRDRNAVWKVEFLGTLHMTIAADSRGLLSASTAKPLCFQALPPKEVLSVENRQGADNAG